MKCLNCNGGNLKKVTIEGVCFSLVSDLRKTFTRGIYGFFTYVCCECGTVKKAWRLPETSLRLLNELLVNKNLETKIVVKGANVNCSSCGSSEMVEGTLEGMYFKPSKENKKGIFSRPIHHPHTKVCLKCGEISEIILDKDEIRKSFKE